MTKTKAFVSISAVFVMQLIFGLIDEPIITSCHELAPRILYLMLRTEIFAVAAGILLKLFVGKAGWAVLFCSVGTIAALAAGMLFNYGTILLIEIFFLMVTAPIAALYYLFTYIFITKPKNEVLFICVASIVTVVLTIIFFSLSLMLSSI